MYIGLERQDVIEDVVYGESNKDVGITSKILQATSLVWLSKSWALAEPRYAMAEFHLLLF
jgi:hypothetical protein